MDDDKAARLIDSAVRDVMNVDTDPAFVARLRARLSRPAPRHWSHSPAFALAAAAVVVIVAGSLLWQPAPAGPPRQERARTAARSEAPAGGTMARMPPPPASPTRPAALPPSSSASPTPGDAVARGPAAAEAQARPDAGHQPAGRQKANIPAGRVVAAHSEPHSRTPFEDSPEGRGIAPLAHIDAIAIAPLAPAPIAPKEIVIASLAAIPAIQVEPLFPPDERE